MSAKPPTESDDLIAQAWDLARKKQIKEAIALLESDTTQSDRRYSSLASFFYMLMDLVNTRLCCEKALHINPRNYRALTTLGDCEARSHNFELAERHYRDAHAISPGNAYIAIRLARVFLKIDKPFDAVSLLEGSRISFPENAAILELLDQAYLFSGDIENSQRIRQIKRSPNNDSDDRAILNFIISLSDNPPEKAIASLRKVLKTGSYQDNPKLKQKLATLLIQLENYEEAAATLEDLIRINPRADSLKIQLSICYSRSRRGVEALALLDSMTFLVRNPDFKIARIEALMASDALQEAMDLTVSELLDRKSDKQLRRLLIQLKKRGVKPNKELL